ncbi:alpha/beta hydrolase [Alkanindiges sp. WGS2144]|uniref:alpha/beta hydrolase n=1 Tax=Alkanindiges sp. WGS2144 TaxID=3366808 RepID=UPI003750432B
MFKIARPKPIFYPSHYPADAHGVLLLHGFTGTPQDLKKLANFLKSQGFACYAPIYKAHGLGAEAIVGSGITAWWQDALDAFEFLQSHGYGKISIVGHSMGGVFALRLAQDFKLASVTTMCSPIKKRPLHDLTQRLIAYAEQYKKYEQKTPEHIQQEITDFAQSDFSVVQGISDFTEQTGQGLAEVKCPLLVLQGELDDVCYQQSAQIIYEQAGSAVKEIKTYANSGHMLMLEADHQKVFRDIVGFLRDSEHL